MKQIKGEIYKLYTIKKVEGLGPLAIKIFYSSEEVDLIVLEHPLSTQHQGPWYPFG